VKSDRQIRAASAATLPENKLEGVHPEQSYITDQGQAELLKEIEQRKKIFVNSTEIH
jgi:hypothetical protein